ncbi:hypothetical protein [Occallatibacter savannae]|uniref:hypothetical protein n=1 Tax=Occallatibacter savannae TaxID=1002691 RepID=UPI0013A537C8|nr:hypothetical protein [Occallatibacter savannae]
MRHLAVIPLTIAAREACSSPHKGVRKRTTVPAVLLSAETAEFNKSINLPRSLSLASRMLVFKP